MYAVYMFVGKKVILNRTLAIDSRFQTFAVGLVYRLVLPLLSPEMLSSSIKSLIFLYNTLFVQMDDTITREVR